MKNILLVGDYVDKNSALSEITKLHNYKIRKIKNMNKAIGVLKKYSPDFVICAGKIKLNANGKYVLELS